MAEAGAHLTATSVNERPSIFEVVAQESLMQAVRPALGHAVKVLAEANPSRFGFLWRRFDELYLLLDLLLQNHHLSHCSASFSENFYGLKRVSAGHPAHFRLHRKSQWRSLLLLCLAPYLQAKLEAKLARQKDEEDFSIRLAQTRYQKLYRVAMAAYPYISSAWQAWVFFQQLMFVFGAAKTHNPLLWLAGVKLARLNAQDIRYMELRNSKTGNAAERSPMQSAWWVMSQAARGTALSLSTSLSFGVFFLQFLEWWYSSDNQSTVKALTSLPAPPPPLHLQQEHCGPDARRGADGRSCPLCLRCRTNATALSTSGFVFCYRCIYTYVKANRRCPLTGYRSELQHLIKIYPSEN